MNRFEVVINKLSDLAIKVSGKTIEDFFANSAFAAFCVLTGDMGEFKKNSANTEKFVVVAEDQKSLLIAFLNELLFRGENFNRAYKAFSFNKLSETKLECIAYFEKIKKIKYPIRAVIFNNFKITKSKIGYFANISFEI